MSRKLLIRRTNITMTPITINAYELHLTNFSLLSLPINVSDVLPFSSAKKKAPGIMKAKALQAIDAAKLKIMSTFSINIPPSISNT